MVVTARLATELTGVVQDRTARLSICTVQAPHCEMPQPYFVPFKPSTSRKTQSSGVSPGTYPRIREAIHHAAGLLSAKGVGQ